MNLDMKLGKLLNPDIRGYMKTGELANLCVKPVGQAEL